MCGILLRQIIILLHNNTFYKNIEVHYALFYFVFNYNSGHLFTQFSFVCKKVCNYLFLEILYYGRHIVIASTFFKLMLHSVLYNFSSDYNTNTILSLKRKSTFSLNRCIINLIILFLLSQFSR